MQSVTIRVAVFTLSTLFAFIPASWAAYGVTFDGSILAIHLETMAYAALTSVVGGLGISAVVFALWGTGGIAGLARTVVYALSPILTIIASYATGWGISFQDEYLSIELETLVAAFITGSGLSFGILNRWGVR